MQVDRDDFAAQADLVRRVYLELFDEGLILCVFASEEEINHLDRDELYRILEAATR